ncbi:MAG: NADH-quinone oxidoreductase subunit G [Kordiimonas sp.]|nr:NADH-quinone oxidoreductase subunit G [Kordiimonas sp.]
MPTLTIDGNEVTVENGTTVLQACEVAGIEVPRFCYHERLSIAGNCRMCLVEMEKAPKLVASCAMPAGDGMVIHTNTEKVKKAREGVMEFLLINHPLDCPICDQGGECDLQDQSMAYGIGQQRYDENRRSVREKNMGPLIKTEMTRCIHCTRCVRFAEEVAGVPDLGAINRGENTEIMTYLEHSLASEMSGNVVDLCPVGALTSKPYAFSARPWELKHTETIDVHDAVGSNIRIDVRGREVMRALPRVHEDVNEEWISDKTRHAVDGLKYRRLDQPYVRVNGELQPASWQDAFAAIAAKTSGLSGEKMAAFVGDMQDMESMYALKQLMTSLGSKNIECRQDGANLDASERASYLFNSGIAGIDEADLILLVGTNPRLEAAVLNARILENVRARGLKVASIGAEADLTYDVEHLGEDASVLAELAAGKGDIFKALQAAEKPMLIVGQGALAREDGAVILKLARDLADKAGMVSEHWNGFNVLHTAAARVGGLDLGLVAENGQNINSLLGRAEAGEIEFVYLLGADEFDVSKLKDSFVVYQGTHGDAAVSVADVILPGAAYTEKDGTYINTEGRVQKAVKANVPPGDAREDWTILRALSEVVGHVLPFDTAAELNEKLVNELHLVDVVDVKPQAAWGDFGVEGDVAAGALISPVTDFYQTNPIARASKTMAACSAEFVQVGVALEEATGTHG